MTTTDLDSARAARFWAKVDKTDGCWQWTAALNAYGYGYFRTPEGARVAHRISYALCVGPVPSGMQLDHLCRNRACVNPSHLEPVTQAENLRRGAGLGGALSEPSDTCRNGHQFGSRTYTDKRGYTRRICSQCAAESQRRTRANRKAAA